MSQSNISQEALVSCQWLADYLEDPQVRVIEVSSSPSDASYREGHLPGAAWWFWKEALWHPTDREFITPQELAQRLGGMGISPQTTVVLYGSPAQFGTYAFWVLTMAGHQRVRLLDGGRKRWVAEGRPLSQEIPGFSPVSYPAPNADPSSRVGRDEVRSRLGQAGRLLL
ncbi:MAG: sulfurtransferase, partial [Dehalococcoidia bacterium]